MTGEQTTGGTICGAVWACVCVVGLCWAPAGCSKSNDAELERARAETEELRKRLDALEGKPTASGSSTADFWLWSKNEGKTSATATPPTPSFPPRTQSVTSKPKVGTLHARIPREFTSTSIGPPGPWLFIDRKLIRNYSDRSRSNNREDIVEDLTLLPGTYLVEVVSPALSESQIFDINECLNSSRVPLRIGSSEVRVEADRVQNVDLTPAEVDVFGVAAYVVLGYRTAEQVQTWTTAFDRQSASYAEDLLAVELNRLATQFRGRRPDQSKVLLNIPEKYGGPREIDADLARVLVDYLKRQYWGQWPFYGSSPPDANASDELRAAYKVMAMLDAGVRKKREEVDELKSIARELEAAARRQ